MPTTRPRLGLSFEVAPPAAVHPLRTDIACLVGTVARRRRRASNGPQALPVVLVRWLESHGIDKIGGVPLRRVRATFADRAGFIAALVALADVRVPQGETRSEAAVLGEFLSGTLDAPRVSGPFDELLHDCRELSPLPEALVEDLRVRGFHPAGFLRPDNAALDPTRVEILGWLRVQRLLNVPVGVETFEAFDTLFAWDQRGVHDRKVAMGDPVVAAALGVAVRAFFGEGGRRAYIVRTGDPSDVFDAVNGRFAACFPGSTSLAAELTPFDSEADRCPQLPGIKTQGGALAGVVGDGVPAAMSAQQWVGLEHVYGLPDVSFALLPDLIDACAQRVPPDVPPDDVVAAPERFVDCVLEAKDPKPRTGRRLPPPRVQADGLEKWRKLVMRAAMLLDNPGRAFHRRDVQLLASLPLLGDGSDMPAPTQWMSWMAQTPGWMSGTDKSSGMLTTTSHADGLLSDRVQLAYPWLRTGESADSQGGVEAPEGTLAGVLARSALERGSYRSAAHQPLHRFHDSEPVMGWSQATQQAVWTPLGSLTLAERVCLLGPTPRGPRLLSDVTCAAEAHTRQASVRRLINVVVQASRNAGDEFAFESNGEALWARVRERLSDLMRVLLAAGALSSDGVPFVVRCGRDTMRQNDIDAGRLISEIELQPAQPIQRIVVVLNLRDAGSAPMLASAA
jgi:hypothetical protein